jgi:hypothetical protein
MRFPAGELMQLGAETEFSRLKLTLQPSGPLSKQILAQNGSVYNWQN